MPHNGIRALTGLVTVAVIARDRCRRGGLFQGSFTDTVPVTVVSPRAGLVMNPDAKVKMRGVQVGKVASIESLPDGQAALHLAMDPVAVAIHSRQRARRHHVVDGVRRQVRRAGTTGGTLGAAPPCRPGARQPARHGRDQHGVPATDVGAGHRSTRAKLNETLGALARHSAAGAHSLAKRSATWIRFWPSWSRAFPR